MTAGRAIQTEGSARFICPLADAASGDWNRSIGRTRQGPICTSTRSASQPCRATSTDDYLAAGEPRRWDSRGGVGTVRDFRRNGLSDDDMVRELIAVEMDVHARALARLGSPPAD